MKEYPLSPLVKEKAEALQHKILKDHRTDIKITGSEHEGDAIFIFRTDFEYRLRTIKDEFFEGDGLIIEFQEDTDLRPMYIMISHKTLMQDEK